MLTSTNWPMRPQWHWLLTTPPLTHWLPPPTPAPPPPLPPGPPHQRRRGHPLALAPPTSLAEEEPEAWVWPWLVSSVSAVSWSLFSSVSTVSSIATPAGTEASPILHYTRIIIFLKGPKLKSLTNHEYWILTKGLVWTKVLKSLKW